MRDTGDPIHPGVIGGQGPKGRAKPGQSQTGKALKDAGQIDPATLRTGPPSDLCARLPGSNSSPLMLGLVGHLQALAP